MDQEKLHHKLLPEKCDVISSESINDISDTNGCDDDDDDDDECLDVCILPLHS